MNKKIIFLFLIGSSILLLGGAWFFQLVLGYAPCEFCLWQRIPHYIVAGTGLLYFLRVHVSMLIFISQILYLCAAGLAIYHSGVERHLWQGFTSCSSAQNLSGLSIDALRATLHAMPLTRCDEIAWQFLGLSMANIHALWCIIVFTGSLWFIRHVNQKYL